MSHPNDTYPKLILKPAGNKPLTHQDFPVSMQVSPGFSSFFPDKDKLIIDYKSINIHVCRIDCV